MPEKRGALGELLSQLTKTLLKRLGTSILQDLKRRLLLGTVAIALLLVGFIFVCVGLVQLLSVLVPTWASWILVGFGLTTIGCLVYLFSHVS